MSTHSFPAHKTPSSNCLAVGVKFSFSFTNPSLQWLFETTGILASCMISDENPNSDVRPENKFLFHPQHL